MDWNWYGNFNNKFIYIVDHFDNVMVQIEALRVHDEYMNHVDHFYTLKFRIEIIRKLASFYMNLKAN